MPNPPSKEREREPLFFRALKKYSLYYGLGAAGCLQLIKTDLLSFPPSMNIYLGYLFSFITLFCAFLAGGTLLGLGKHGSDFIRKKLDDDEERTSQNR